MVDDSDADVRPVNEAIVTALEREEPRTIYMENQRTRGACGAWNSALYEVQRIAPSAFVAILDDDDMWEAEYLRRCEETILHQDLDMVAAGIVFNKIAGQQGELLRSPESLNVDDLLVRNPFIQGSNLFVRLEKLLEAGGFDEALMSTTDRDICIRLADLGTVKYGRIEECLVLHYAESDRPRLSTPGSEAKCAGLRTFYHKYAGRMSAEQRESFIARSRDVFGCDPTLDIFEPDAARHQMNDSLLGSESRTTVEEYLKTEFDTGELTCLGIGQEGVVLTDGRLVYKTFHDWKARNRDGLLNFLRSLVGRLSGFRALPDVQEVSVRGDRLTITYPYTPGTKYEGGRLDELFVLLRDCREAGIACRNIHPDNLLVTETGLMLIDIGFDIVPYTEDDFEQMCRRAFLSYRFHFRSDLKRLMTRSLTDADMPELTGYDGFMRALAPRGLDELFYRPLALIVGAESPRLTLDYGCGDGRLAELLALQGISVTAYDPDDATLATCNGRIDGVEYGGNKLLDGLLSESAKFDCVVCSRVLCAVEDAGEFDAILRNLRQLVSDSGSVFVAVCNPLHLTTTSTELGARHLPEGQGYTDTFGYAKTVASSGNTRKEAHRSLSIYRRAFRKAGLRIERILELDGMDTRELLPASDHLVFKLVPMPANGPKVSLLIKTCLMEWCMIERMVRHQVEQLEEPVGFMEKVVVVDPTEGPFSRQYDNPNPAEHRAAMERLLNDGVVDKVIYAPRQPDVIRDTYRRWFGSESTATHSTNGQQLFATLYGFEACKGDYVLQLDSDLLIARRDRERDYLQEMVRVLHHDRKALFASMSICVPAPTSYTAEGADGDWRVEVRGCLFEKDRLLSALPIENQLKGDRFALPWHRAFDKFISAGEYRSYRGGHPGVGYIHVPNERKTDKEDLLDILDSVERGYIPDVQLGSVDLRGTDADWAGPKRSEPFVFVICGRNVHSARFKRCVESLLAQKNRSWGALVVDDASTNGFGDYAETLLSDYTDRVTLVKNRSRRGLLFNTWRAVTRFCDNPDSVIITLDADDALIGPYVLDKVHAEYDAGADVTVGSMLRLDKEARYPADFNNPRSWDGNVWQHLRTFRKYLFDAIRVEDLKVSGEWIGLANDWAFMLPIVEMAASPRRICEPLYLYEPTKPKTAELRQRRDAIIARILTKPRYQKLRR